MNINEEKDTRPIMVSIRCTAYNHEKYIRDALEGFVMQKTNFRFEAVVHDDASTDGTADIIREYAEKYPDIIKPIYETENQYSKHDGSLAKIMNANMRGKYIAFCEGDDYWIDPLKLQKQVDFMEAHEEYSMCWTDAYEINDVSKEKKAYNRYDENKTSPTEDIIAKGGAFVPSCSMVFRTSVFLGYFSLGKRYYVLDYPIQMWCAFKGKVYYIKEQTCVYRFMSEGSWTQGVSKETKEQTIKRFENEKIMLDDFNQMSDYKYQEAFERRAADFLFCLLVQSGEYIKARPYLSLRNKYNISTDRVTRLKIGGHPLQAKAVLLYRKIKIEIKIFK